MNNIEVLWQEIQAQEPDVYMVCAATCKIFIGDRLVAEHECMTTAIDLAWLEICKPCHDVPV